MVILKRIYSETGLFDEVKFSLGINLIKGVYTKTPAEKTELNGIGKSTLIRLVDFALLSKQGKNFFDVKKHEFFKEHSITLEFEVDGTVYFIRREFSSPDKVSFGNEIESLEEYTVVDLRIILGGLVFGKDGYKGAYENAWFRSLMRFFIKDDINHHERKDPLKFVSPHDSNFETYVYNLFLLGLPNLSINGFSVLKKKTDDLHKMRRGITRRIAEETGKKIGEIHSEIDVLDRKIAAFQESLEKYEFLNSYEDVEKELISISGEVSGILRKLTPIERKLAEYRKSYKYEIEINAKKISQLYSEVKIVFGDAVRKQLDEVVSFRKKLAENRKRFLSSRETVLLTEIEELKNKISSLEKRRTILYRMLDEKNALDSLKNTYQLLVEEKTKREKLVVSIESIQKIDDALLIQNTLMSEAVSNISSELNGVQEQIRSIRSLFLDIVSASIQAESMNEAVFDIRPSPDMRSPVEFDIDVPKSDALGKQRLKVLAYDLTVFLQLIENKRMLPCFLVHDGVFHGIGIKTIVKVLNFVNSRFLQDHNFQYIITANENEILVPDNKKSVYGEYNFDIDSATIATYKDIPEEMIFKREY